MKRLTSQELVESRATVTVMLNTNRATVYVVAGVYHGEIGEEVSRTPKMAYVKLLGPGTTLHTRDQSPKPCVDTVS